MRTTTADSLEQLGLEGPIVWPLAVVAGVALLVFFAWALRRELRVIGRRSAVLFWLLRAAALAIVVWMLLAPATIRVERSTTRQSIAIVTDVSRSMSIIDPSGTSDELRWALSSVDASDTAIVAADRALAAAGLAERYLGTASRALREHRAQSGVLEAAQAAKTAIDHVRNHVAALVRQSHRWESNGDPQSASSLVMRIRSMLEGPDLAAFAELVKALERGRTPEQHGWRESLPDLEHRMAGMRRRLAELSRSVADAEGQRMAEQHSQTLASINSMSRMNRAANAVKALETRVFRPLQRTVDVRYSALDKTLTALPTRTAPDVAIRRRGESKADPDDQTGLATNLSAVFEQLHRDRQRQPLAAVFLTTDMIHNDPESPDPRLAAETWRGTPIYVVPVGNTRHVRDVILQSLLAPNIAMRNDDVVIEASLQAYDSEGETCSVELIHNGEVIDRREVYFDSEASTRTVRFEQRMSEVGVHQYQVSIAPLAGELSSENNFDHFEVNVTRGEIKVLLADEMPRWEYRYLTQLFRRAPKIECDELLFRPRMIATGRRAESYSFPVTVDEWDQYDVVILGDVATEHLPVAAQQSLIEYLQKRGGTLVIIAGHEAMPQHYVHQPLEEILPVAPVQQEESRLKDFAFYVTQRGRDHSALMIGENAEATRLAWEFINRNVPLNSLSRYRRPLPAARTLIGAIPEPGLDEESASQQSAFLCWQPVKRGRVIYLSGPESYRLRFLRGDRLHYRLWGQLLRWAIASDLAAGSDRIRVRTDKSRYGRNETVQIVIRLADEEEGPLLDADVEAVATGADGRQFAVPLIADEEIPGQYRGEFRQPDPGVYRVEARGPAVESLLPGSDSSTPATASFTVRADLPQELLDTRCDLALAHQLADATGGQVLPPTAVEEIVALTDLEPEVSQKVERRPLWVQWKFLWIVFGCLQTEWIVRKWKGFS